MGHQFILIEGVDHVESFAFLSLICDQVHVGSTVASNVSSRPHHRLLRIVGIMNKEKGTVGGSGFSTSLPNIQGSYTLFMC